MNHLIHTQATALKRSPRDEGDREKKRGYLIFDTFTVSTDNASALVGQSIPGVEVGGGGVALASEGQQRACPRIVRWLHVLEEVELLLYELLAQPQVVQLVQGGAHPAVRGRGKGR